MPRIFTNHKRLLLFLGAVLAPSTLLIVFAVLGYRHEEALARQAAVDARRQSARQVAQQLLLTLEQLRLRSAAAPNGLPDSDSRGILLARRLGGGLAGSSDRGTPRPPASEAARIRAAELAEFGGKLDRAIVLYTDALEAAPDPGLTAQIRLGLARTLARAGRAAVAASHYKTLLALPLDLRDDEGIPFALYAADRLEEFPQHRVEVAERVALALGGDRIRGRLEAHMLLDLASSLDDGARADSLRASAERHIARAAQLASLERDLAALLRLRASRPHQPGTWRNTWLRYGDPLWIVGAEASPDGLDTLLFIVDAREAAALVSAELSGVVPGPVRLVADGTDMTGEPLAPEFPGLRAEFPIEQPRITRTAALGAPLLLSVLMLAALAAYLLWRDVRRETRAAAIRSRFVSAVSHELKTPLTSIRMFAELLRMQPDDTERHRPFLDTIIGESERLTRLIDNVLHFSRIESHRQRYILTRGDIQEVVREAAAAMEYPMAQEGLRLRVEVDDTVPPVAVDRDAMTHAVFNLLSNAVKFSPGGGEIALSLARANGDALITVRDDGLGIATEEHARIFEEFYRSPGAEARGIEGTGLGLALVSDVARAHGGGVEVTSALGAGSVFTIRIPLEPAR